MLRVPARVPHPPAQLLGCLPSGSPCGKPAARKWHNPIALTASAPRCLLHSGCPPYPTLPGACCGRQPGTAPSRLRPVPPGRLRRQGDLPRQPGSSPAAGGGGRLRQLRRRSDLGGTCRFQVSCDAGQRAVCGGQGTRHGCQASHHTFPTEACPRPLLALALPFAGT